jgi:diguanylate cyclase (GGDEF)-like protein
MPEQYSSTGVEAGAANRNMRSIEEVRSLVGQKIELPSPPNIVMRILQAVQDDDSCFAGLAKIISADPSLTAKLLRVANSSIYGFGGRVKNIESALSILGINALKNIALSFIIVRKCQGASTSVFDFEYFWKRSVTAAVAAKMLASLRNYDSNDIFVSGLLQDIGVLVLFQHCPDSYREVLALKNSTETPGHIIERQFLGMCHAELGGALLQEWGLPESIYLPLFYHHRADCAPYHYRTGVELLNLADKISAIYHSSQSRNNVADIFQTLTSDYGLTEKEIKELIDTVATRANEVLSFFDMSGDEIRPLSEMLQDANQELGKLNCSYEQLVMDLKQAKEESSKYVGKLIDANKKYRELAYRDELTGLYNNRYFQELMEKELERSRRYEHALSLLFFDIDYFKEINDNFGHLAGDTVLRRVAEKIIQIMRGCDIVVRYGGDEFAVIMPETGREGLEVFAERIRRGIEEMIIPADQASLQVTVSVGGATFNSKNPQIDKRAMFSTADKAIYQAKGGGRNRIHIVEI